MPITRRHFVTAGTPALLASQSPNDVIRVAVIGVGNRGSYLLKHTLALGNVKVVAVADLEPERLRLAAQAANGPATYTDFRKMLDERKDIDAVLIATPVDTHKAVSIGALELGKHVYCEKPLAHTVDDIEVITKAARSARGIFQAGFQLRHDPNRAAAMRFLHGGGLGRLLFCQGYRHTGDLPRQTLWYFDRSRSGDNIVEQACHILDLFVWAIGKPPLRAMGSGGVSLYQDTPPGRTTMDNYAVIYEFPGAVRVVFSHIYFDPPGFSGIHERVFGEKGAVELSTARWMELGSRAEIALEVPDAGQDSTRLALAAFFDNSRRRATPLNDIASGRISTLTAILGRTAIHEGRIVQWKEVAADSL